MVLLSDLAARCYTLRMQPPQTNQPPNGTPVDVMTRFGALRGTWSHGAARFAGIPFAAPPIGEGRFRPPSPPVAWDEVRPAHQFGPMSPQNPSLMDALFGGESERWDEDCLHLNVWSPDPTPRAALPVMVWIHGGGFEMGSGSSPLYDGTSFARDGVVFVSINYRLGAFGFLDLGDLDPSYAGSGNVGLLDQIASLEWVRDNISGFGGDPGRVTIFGESAGAMSVSLLMAMPRARGLFHGVIAESGHASAGKTPEMAALDTVEFLAACGLGSVADVLSAPVEQLLAGHATMGAARIADPEEVIRRTGNPLAFLPFRPVADGHEVPLDPLAAIADGSAARVPLLVGTNSEEWNLFALMSPPATDEAQLRERLSLVITDPGAALDAYRAEHPDTDLRGLEGAILTDLIFRLPVAQLADAHSPHADVFQYLWTWRSQAWGGMIGAAHAIEIPFVFDLVADHRLHVFVGSDAPASLARATHLAWVQFACTGAPSHDGLPGWPTMSGDERHVMVLDTEPGVLPDPQGATRRFWGTDSGVMPIPPR